MDLKPCPERLKQFQANLVFAKGDLTDADFVEERLNNRRPGSTALSIWQTWPGCRGAGRPCVRHPVDGMEFEILDNDVKGKRNLNWRVTITARNFEESGGWHKHGGEEFQYVISGELSLLTQLYNPLTLRAGDSVVFDADTEHTYVPVSDEPTVLIMTNAVSF